MRYQGGQPCVRQGDDEAAVSECDLDQGLGPTLVGLDRRQGRGRQTGRPGQVEVGGQAEAALEAGQNLLAPVALSGYAAVRLDGHDRIDAALGSVRRREDARLVLAASLAATACNDFDLGHEDAPSAGSGSRLRSRCHHPRRSGELNGAVVALSRGTGGLRPRPRRWFGPRGPSRFGWNPITPSSVVTACEYPCSHGGGNDERWIALVDRNSDSDHPDPVLLGLSALTELEGAGRTRRGIGVKAGLAPLPCVRRAREGLFDLRGGGGTPRRGEPPSTDRAAAGIRSSDPALARRRRRLADRRGGRLTRIRGRSRRTGGHETMAQDLAGRSPG